MENKAVYVLVSVRPRYVYLNVLFGHKRPRNSEKRFEPSLFVLCVNVCATL